MSIFVPLLCSLEGWAVCLRSPWHLAVSTPILIFHFFLGLLFHQSVLWTSDFILAYCLLHFPFTSYKGQNAFFNRLQVAILSFLLILFLSETIFLRHGSSFRCLELCTISSHTRIYFSKSSIISAFTLIFNYGKINFVNKLCIFQNRERWGERNWYLYFLPRALKC